MPDSPREAHVMVDLLNTQEIMVLSYDNEPMEGFEDEDDLEEDQKIDEIV